MITLRHFTNIEFAYPEQMDEEFLLWLDDVREIASVPFHITSDFRDAERNAAVGGKTDSLHLSGRAVDIRWPATAQQLAQINEAVAFVSGSYQLVYEVGKSSKHIHLGLYPDNRPPTMAIIYDFV